MNSYPCVEFMTFLDWLGLDGDLQQGKERRPPSAGARSTSSWSSCVDRLPGAEIAALASIAIPVTCVVLQYTRKNARAWRFLQWLQSMFPQTIGARDPCKKAYLTARNIP